MHVRWIWAVISWLEERVRVSYVKWPTFASIVVKPQELSNNTSEARARLDTWPRAGAGPSVPTAVTEAYNRAGQEFTALRAANRYDARIGELRTRYATADPSFEGIRQAVFAAVGGYGEAGPPTLSLDQL